MQTKDMLANLFGVKGYAACEVCGNEYDKCFEVRLNGETRTFDCFECAIHALAPKCARCGCRIIGHGMEQADGVFFCCAHCANQYGAHGFEDRVAVVERSPA
ncbi:MAG: hypothetical protein AB1750_04360 [Chloroflexota bacterium]